MSNEQKSTPVKQRLKRVVRAIRLPKKSASKRAGPPEWLGVGVSRDGKKRVYYLRLRFPRPLLLAVLRWRKFSIQHRVWSRVIAIGLVLVILAGVFIDTYTPKKKQIEYDISGPVSNLIGDPVPQYESKLTTDPKTGTIKFNSDYTPQTDVAGISSTPKITAQFAGGTTNAVTVDDPVNKVSVTFTPKFAVASPQKNINRVVYPLVGRNASAIYSLKGIGVKEDFVLRSMSDDEMSFDYDLSLSDGLEARLDKDGSLGVYGSSAPLYGNITTSTDKDAKLLQKARQNAKKDKLIFKIPVPYIKEANKHKSAAKAWFSLKGKKMTVTASNLKAAAYPLSIDPSIYVETAAKLMRGNNETNIDFDATNELIQKSQTTGARIDTWSSTNNLSAPIWQQGTAVAGGYIYSAGGIEGSTTASSTYYTAGTYASGTGGFTVPAGVTSLTIKAWGAGGGGGAGVNSSGRGGDGGGGGYTKSVVTVTAGDNLTIDVGSGGARAGGTRQGGDGGGYSAVTNATTATLLLKAGAGGGGGGAEGTSSGNGGAGGAGGGINGVAGSNGAGSGFGSGGARGTSSAGGAGGAAGTSGATGATGVANAGGDGGGSTGTCNASVAGNTGGGGIYGGGGDGGNDTSSCEGGGGGGGGRYGGGGGGSVNSNNRGAGGGGGGSDYVTGSSQVETAGSGTTPGNSADSERNGAGLGGSGGTTNTNASAGADGGVVISYTITGTGITSKLSWSKFNSSTKAIESPDPGTGTCSGWCTNSLYDLPAARTNLSLVAYNGFLYAIGGDNSGGTPQTSVYIAKLGANGEPSLWHPSGGTPVYWYTDTALSAARSKFAAVAYNNKMYILGGLTTSNTLLSSNTVQSASINPTGTFTTWSTTGMSALSAARYGLTAQVYNDTLYVIGGDATFTGSPITTVEFSRLNSDGTMNSWVTTSLLTSGRMTMGGSFSTIWGAYVYVGGGCTAVNGSGYCTAIASDVQLASINADGSLAPFNTIIGLTNSRIGHTLIAWQGGLYRLGGCRAQDGTSGACTDTIFDVDYGVINQEGEASTVANSVGSGTAPCSGVNPYNCDLPGISIIGNVLSGSAILNGYLYIWGGCSNSSSGCGTVSRGVVYTSVGSDGSLTKPASCGSWTNTDSWCYNTTSLPVGGVGAPGVAVFNGYIYSVGGFTAGSSVGQVYYASPSTADGTISSWGNQSITGIGAENVSYPFSFARANPSSAGSTPGNLYIMGGCLNPGGIGCSNYTDGVYKCTLNTSGVPGACSKNPGGTNQQLQIGIVPGDTQAGLGAMAGTVYANYIYLMGGLTPNQTDIKTTRYAKIDNNNNIVAVSGGAWVESSNLTYYGRRRGAGFGYNGYLYVAGGYDGSGGGGGVLADIEFAKINVSDGSIGAWSVSSVSIDQRWGLSMTVSNSYAYVIGGCVLGSAPTCSAGGQTDSIQTFQIYNNDSGAISQYNAGNTLGVDRTGGSSTIMNGYIYYAGGCTVIGCGTLTKTTYYASLDAYGTVGSWSSGGALPGAGGVAWGKLVNAGGTLYYVGGQTGSANTSGQATVYYTTSISSGNPTWGTAANGLPAARTQIGAAVWNDRIYVLGGYSTGGAVQTSVYSSPQQSTGGDIGSAWSSSSTAFNIARAGASAVAYANNLYILGGNDGTNYLSDVQFSQISTSTGLAGSWTYSTNMPDALSDGDGFASNGYLYVVGGRSATATCRPVTLFAPISANTTIATGNNPTGVGTWSETNQKYTGDRFGAAVSYSGGKVYLIGGGCSAMVSSGDRMYYSTLKSQPQVAKYSIMIDTDTDVFPTGWLMNGLDNSIGARWKMNYQSMSDNDTVVSPTEDCGTTSSSPAMTTWGTTINYGNVTLGTVAPYVPRNGTVINTGTISQTGTSVTASSSVFTDEIIGGVLTYADGTTANIVSRTSGTVIVVDSSTKSGISGQTYSAAGGNIHCARFYYMLVTIDSSQAFGYPEDVTRGPTIADLSLFFTADPSKRLRHGKTFTGGLQQPLDTPCRVSGANPSGSQPNCPLP